MKKWITICVLVLSLLCSLSGCGKKTEEDKTVTIKKGSFYLYYLNQEENGLYPVEYDLDSSYNEEDAAIEILKLLSKTDPDQEAVCKPSIGKDMEVSFQSYMDGVLTIDLSGGFRKLAESSKVLCKASLVYTFNQIKTIDQVCLTVDGQPMLEYNSPESNGSSSLTKNNFCIGMDALYDNAVPVSLFLSNKEGTKLREYAAMVHIKSDETLEYAIVRTLRDFKENEDFRPPLPKDLKIISVEVHGDTCYVNLDEKIDEPILDMSKEVCIHAIVESLLSLDRLNRVQMLINGALVSDLSDYSDYDQLYMKDYGFANE